MISIIGYCSVIWGCDIRYRDENSSPGAQNWVLVNNNVKPNSFRKRKKAFFLILDLKPETHYSLRITAHNSAGSTVGQFPFTTLSSSGATIAPELIIHSEYGGIFGSFSASVAIPIFIALVLTVVTVATSLLLVVNKFGKSFRGGINEMINNVPTAQ